MRVVEAKEYKKKCYKCNGNFIFDANDLKDDGWFTEELHIWCPICGGRVNIDRGLHMNQYHEHKEER